MTIDEYLLENWTTPFQEPGATGDKVAVCVASTIRSAEEFNAFANSLLGMELRAAFFLGRESNRASDILTFASAFVRLEQQEVGDFYILPCDGADASDAAEYAVSEIGHLFAHDRDFTVLLFGLRDDPHQSAYFDAVKMECRARF